LNKITKIDFISGNISKHNVSKRRKCCGILSITIDDFIKVWNILIYYEPYNNEFVCIIPTDVQWQIMEEQFTDIIRSTIEQWGNETFGEINDKKSN